MGKPGDSINNALTPGFGDVHSVLPLMFHGGTHIPSSFAFVSSRASFVGLFMSQNADTWWCQGGLGIIKHTMEMMVSRVRSGGTETGFVEELDQLWDCRGVRMDQVDAVACGVRVVPLHFGKRKRHVPKT